MLLDFDPAVTGIASQPFWSCWHDQAGAGSRTCPGFFARRGRLGGGVVGYSPTRRR